MNQFPFSNGAAKATATTHVSTVNANYQQGTTTSNSKQQYLSPTSTRPRSQAWASATVAGDDTMSVRSFNTDIAPTRQTTRSPQPPSVNYNHYSASSSSTGSAHTSPNLSKNLSLPTSPVYQGSYNSGGYPKSDNGSPDVSPKTQTQQSLSNIPRIVTSGPEYRSYAASDPGYRSDFSMPAPRPRLTGIPETDWHNLDSFIKDTVGTGAIVAQGSRLSEHHVQYGGKVGGIAHSAAGSVMPFAHPQTSLGDSEESRDFYEENGLPLTPTTSFGYPSPCIQRQNTPQPHWDRSLNNASLFPELNSHFGSSMSTGVSYPNTHAYANSETVNPAAVNSQLALAAYASEDPALSPRLMNRDYVPYGQEIVPSDSRPTPSRPSSCHSNYRREGGDSVIRPANYVPQSSLGKRTRDESAISTEKYRRTLPPPAPRQNNQRVRHECKRPFHCDFTFAGCQQNFASKNEWKRHSNSQHTQPYYWRCDFTNCIDRKTATFNRKDLFGQHLKRMHGPKPTTHIVSKPGQKNQQSPEMTHFINTEIPRIQERCKRTRRELPTSSTCGFCSQRFQGPNSWEERMEHVGRHYENAIATGEDVSQSAWVQDQELIEWALECGIIIDNGRGGYACLSTGKEAIVEAWQNAKIYEPHGHSHSRERRQ
ncbi:hypothetical protein FPQ18DRAFT_163163 [Pyronema domesticum]|uniref:C2H2-type domain-containing protein n=1 Tax=Pyronema omphalodes (strain CBS 100304) TaxID=1076935 RepID=U4LTQ1_PYROM|nr:hypothetical protein FPQ18DRAFT_163163 [Pyronema domesticum]CCX33015.1 Similar to hypothetical protein [Tuber melanosporum Mel28]; acc. no. XP_002837402 [Pyronema omphalodes CBS 100304]